MASGLRYARPMTSPVNIERRRLHRGRRCSRRSTAARARLPERVALLGRQRQRRLDRRRQRSGIAGRHAPAGDAMLHRLDRPAEIGGDHRPAHRLRLDHHPAERLGLRRGVHDDIGQHQRRRHVVALAGEAQPVGNAQRLGLTDQARGVAPAPLVRSHQHAAHVAPRHPRQRLDQHRLPLPAGQPARAAARPAHHPAAATPAPAAPSDRRDTAAGSNTAGIDAARDDPDARGIDPVARHDQLGDEAACRDHPLALRHHRVVAALERQVLAIGRRGRW